MSDLYDLLDEKKKKRKKRKKAGSESSKESSLRDWFGRKGAKGNKKGWVDCNAPDGKGGYKSCGRSSGEKRKRYPACRPTPGACKERGRGKSWGKKSKKSRKNEELHRMDLYQIIEEEIENVITEKYTKKHEKELEKIAGELAGASKMHKGQSDRIKKILGQTDDKELQEDDSMADYYINQTASRGHGSARDPEEIRKAKEKAKKAKKNKNDEPVSEGMNCGCGQDPCETYGKNNEKLIIMIKEELEAVLDEKASKRARRKKRKKAKKKKAKRDACYHKVKSRYKVWPSAYASGALVKCRKVGAKNWGNSAKESAQIDAENQLVAESIELYTLEETESYLEESLYYGLIEETDELNEKKKKKKACKPSKGKKFARRVKGKCVSYGQAGKAKGGGARIKPGTGKGNAYCARSYGDMKSHGKDCSGKDRGTPLCLSRQKWKCSGKYSRKGK